jgi:hypothetical protein
MSRPTPLRFLLITYLTAHAVSCIACPPNNPPQCFISSPDDPLTILAVGHTLTLDVMAYDPDYGDTITFEWEIWKWRWNFKAGSSAQTWDYTFTEAGYYDIYVTVTDSHGAQAFDYREVTVVRVNGMQYQDWCTGQYVDVTGPLYIVKDYAIPFKAIPYPDSVWPSSPTWTLNGVPYNPPGELQQIVFNTLSTSPTDYHIVTASCGTSSVSVNVICFDFAGTLTPRDIFDNRSPTNYGLAEEVDLACTITPSGLTAATVGGVLWRKWSGVGFLSGANPSNGTAFYNAGVDVGTTLLYPRVESGASCGISRDYSRTVVAPSGTRMTRVNPSKVKHKYGYASAGIALYYWLDPTDVSFKYLTFGEGSCPATNTSGIFVTPSPPGDHPQNTFGAILGGNRTTGCRVETQDGPYNEYYFWGSGGAFTWSIPTHYIEPGGARHAFGSNSINIWTILSNGYTTVSKGGQSGSAAVNDDDSDF